MYGYSPQKALGRLTSRRLILVLIFMLVVGLAPSMNGIVKASPWDPANLVFNPGYESVTNGFPNGWGKFVPIGAPDIAADSAVAHDGSASLRVSAQATARGGVNQSVPVTENVYYELSMWIKTDNIVTNDLGSAVRIQLLNNSGGQTGTNLIAGYWKGTKDWTKISYRFRTPPGTVKVLIENFIWNATGTIWFDEVKLVKSGYITGMLRQEHPRLLAGADDFIGIKQRIASDPQASAWYQAVKAEADKILTDPVSQYKAGSGQLLDVSRLVVQRIYKLGMVYRLDGNPVYAERAWKELEAVSAFPDWDPVHFLDTAEMTHGAAIGYDWFYDYWSADRKKTIRDAILAKGLTPGLNEYKTSWWPSAISNWNLVCNGGLAAGALAIGDDPAAQNVAEDILRKGLDSVQPALAQYAPDGGWYEGYWYWDYATKYLTVYLAGMKSALGTDFGLSSSPGVSETGLYPVYMEGPTDQGFNFADSGYGKVQSPDLFWFAEQFGHPELAWFRLKSGGTPESLLWYRSHAYPGPRAAGLPKDKYFRNVEVASLRSAWEDPNALYLGFKGAHEDVSHKHLDAGTFVLDALGVRWASLLGGDNYSLPGYFSYSQRWTYYRTRAEGSNTLAINPGQGPEQDYTKAARITSFRSEAGEAYAIADMQPLYGEKASKAQRGVKFLDQRRQILIQDEVETPAPSDIWWFMHTTTEVQDISPDGKTAVLIQNGKRLWAKILTPQGEFTVMDAQPLPQSPAPAGQSSNIGVRKLAVHVPNVQKLQLSVLMVPLREWENPPASLPAVVPLADWSKPAEAVSLLNGITVNGVPLSGFAQDSFTYDIMLPLDTTSVPVVGGAAADPNALVEVKPASGIPGTAWIKVRDPGAALTTRYAVHFNSNAINDEGSIPVQSVTASANDGNVPENTLDGDYTTRWSAEGDGQWIQYDLGTVSDLRSVSVAWYKGNERKETFDIAVSQDGQTWTMAFSGRSSGRTLEFENYDIGTVSARYVRIVGHGNSLSKFNSITETRIYNKVIPAPDYPVRLQNVSLSAANPFLNIGQSMPVSVTGAMSNGDSADLSSAAIAYYSDNPGVAQVSEDGTVKGMAEGTARITVMVTKDRFVKMAGIQLEVKDPNKLFPLQDVYVRDGSYANTNFGKDGVLLVKSDAVGYNRVSYLQFDVSSLPSNVDTVTLNVYGGITDTGTDVDVYVHDVQDDNWTETGMIWNNRPAVGASIAMEHFNNVPQWHEIDVTGYIKAQAAGDHKAALALQQAGKGLNIPLNSKESARNKPYLQIRLLPDQTPPVTEATYSPSQPDGLDGWYTHPVTISLSAHDNLPGAASTVYSLDDGLGWQPYTGPVTLTQSGTYTLSYRSTDQAGNAETIRMLSFNVDLAGPAIAVSVPVTVTQSTYGYNDVDDLTPQFTLTDDLSGVDPGKTVMELDGRLLQQGTAVPLYTLPLGTHELTITAEDRAGNRSIQTATFATAASISSLQDLVSRFTASGWIDSSGIANSLLQKLNEGELEDLIDEVKAQAGKHISTEVANYLLRDAWELMK